jgi:hypothetical protein
MTDEERFRQYIEKNCHIAHEIMKDRNIEDTDQLLSAMTQAVIDGRRLEREAMVYRIVNSGMRLAAIFSATLCLVIVINALRNTIDPQLAIVGLGIPLLLLIFLKLVDHHRGSPGRPE